MTFTVAVAQIAALPDDPLATAEKAAASLREAAAKGARLVVFPEALLGGYPKGASFGAPIGMRKPEGRAAFARYHAAAIDLDGPEIAVLAEATAETNTFTVIGAIERDGATLYCTALYFDGAKGLVGKHRKLMPTAAERLIWGFGDGSTLPTFKTELGTIGAVICWENYMPALRMHMYHQGVSLYCAPTADDRDTWLPTMQHIAMEGRTFVLTACQYITRAAYGPEHESALGDAPDTVMMRGGSAIIGPLGKVLAGPDFSGETILYAEIDPAEVMRAKYDFDVTGHYARPDIFALSVDTRAKRAVTETLMRWDLDQVAEPIAYKLLAATVMPRPIAWVVTQSLAGTLNAAPYSFFNVMGSAPPTLVLGLMADPARGFKDTAANILATGEFVVNLVPEALVQQMNTTAVDAPTGVSELDLAGLATEASGHIRPPRIAASPVAFECRMLSSVVTGPHQSIVIGRVLAVHIDDRFVLHPERGHIDTPALNLVARSYGSTYVRSRDTFELDRPKWASWSAQNQK